MSDQSAIPSAWIRCQANPVFYLGVNQGGIIGGTVIPLAVGTTLANCFHIIPHLLKIFFSFRHQKITSCFLLKYSSVPPHLTPSCDIYICICTCICTYTISISTSTPTPILIPTSITTSTYISNYIYIPFLVSFYHKTAFFLYSGGLYPVENIGF